MANRAKKSTFEPHRVPTNRDISNMLREIADLLEWEEFPNYRAQAYRKAAKTIDHFQYPLFQLFRREGYRGLMALPQIGRSIAGSLVHVFHHGNIPLLETLRKRHPELNSEQKPHEPSQPPVEALFKVIEQVDANTDEADIEQGGYHYQVHALGKESVAYDITLDDLDIEQNWHIYRVPNGKYRDEWFIKGREPECRAYYDNLRLHETFHDKLTAFRDALV